MTPLEAVGVAAAGLAAGTINTIVGSGSLITFPTLLAVGYPAKLANVSNTIGLVPGSVSGAVGYRRERAGQRRRVLHLLPAALAGGAAGAGLLLALPGTVFRRVVPVLILVAVALVLVQPRLAERRAERGRVREHPGVLLHAGTFATAVYGGYFGAAQGVLLLGFLGLFLADSLQRQNALKNMLAGITNLVAAVYFVAITHVDWLAAGLIAGGSIIGGVLGARVGRRLSPTALRATIVVVGVAAIVKLLV
jgi:uncharacterized membrane protein YfcA